jgi:fatty aldehyde-generating acyl-ACP reductase
MDTFAFIIHPIEPKRDVSRKFPFLGRILNERQINFFSTFFPPVYLSEIEGIVSESTGKQIQGWLIACPLTAERIMSLPEKIVYRKIIETGKLAERLGAMILGLGAFTSVVGDGGLTISRNLDIPVTTGDSYTVATAIQAVLKAARILELQEGSSTAAVVGASGAIGQVCAELLAERVGEIYLLGRKQRSLDVLREKIGSNGGSAVVHTSTDLEVLRSANLILTVTSSQQPILASEFLMPGAVICDVARPRDISHQVALQRKDILVIDGGVVEIPGKANFNFDFGLPPGIGYACMAETIALALEGRFESFTLGKNLTRRMVEEISVIAVRHGFRLSGFRSFDQPVSQEQLEIVYHTARGHTPPRLSFFDLPKNVPLRTAGLHE